MSKIISINADQTKGIADVSRYNRHMKIKAVEHKGNGCDDCIFFFKYNCTIRPTAPSYCTPTRQDKKTVIWVEDKGEENEVITNKTNTKMEANPKYNVGDTAVIIRQDEYRIGKIASISIQGNKIYYYFENIAGKYPEDVVTRYSNNTEEDAKAEKEQKEAPAPTNTTELPKTYEEAIKFLKGNILYFRTNNSTVNGYTIEEWLCNNICNKNYNYTFSSTVETCKKIIQFEKLIFLRDIYRQGWEPDFSNYVTKFCIENINNHIIDTQTLSLNFVLSFQSKEIRDEFYNNFKELIEECKEFI